MNQRITNLNSTTH